MYGRLSAEFYDAEKPKADDSEVEFFAAYLKQAPGPALEAMCGSGRLLIPLLKRGFQIEGVDNSESMLRSLKSRCRRSGLNVPKTYLQELSLLSLPGRYPLIFIALGSIQLLPEDRAIASLERLRSHLTDSGRLIVDTFIPWELIDSLHSRHVSTRRVRGARGVISLRSEIEVDREGKRYTARNHYERRDADVLLQEEDENLELRWYFPERFTEIFSALGMSVMRWDIPVVSPRPRRCIYVGEHAIKTPL